LDGAIGIVDAVAIGARCKEAHHQPTTTGGKCVSTNLEHLDFTGTQTSQIHRITDNEVLDQTIDTVQEQV
jgi:hypothetical protein